MLKATFFACLSFLAPLTSISINFFAPSPSITIFFASSIDKHLSLFENFLSCFAVKVLFLLEFYYY